MATFTWVLRIFYAVVFDSVTMKNAFCTICILRGWQPLALRTLQVPCKFPARSLLKRCRLIACLAVAQRRAFVERFGADGGARVDGNYTAIFRQY
jgi:hypothetical protein